MIEQEFLLLGLLRQSPKHGYEVKLNVRQILSIFAGVELKSVYYPLHILERKGLLTKRISKQGRRPERYVYCLTAKGRRRFDELLNKSFLDFRRPQFSLDLSLYFLDYLPKPSSRRRLRARLTILKKISRGIEAMVSPAPLNKQPLAIRRILEHNLCLLQAESAYLRCLLKTL